MSLLSCAADVTAFQSSAAESQRGGRSTISRMRMHPRPMRPQRISAINKRLQLQTSATLHSSKLSKSQMSTLFARIRRPVVGPRPNLCQTRGFASVGGAVGRVPMSRYEQHSFIDYAAVDSKIRAVRDRCVVQLRHPFLAF